MAKYSGEPAQAPITPQEAFERLSNPERLQALIDQAPEDLRARMGDFHFSPDEIRLGTTQVGDIVLKATRREAPSLIRFEAQDSPVPVALSIHIAPGAEDGTCQVTPDIELDIPAMLQPLVGGKMKQAASQFSTALAHILTL